ncbi:CPCC family cysteine-rich protein [Lysinibacillus pakistanensis]|uniref:CPCC family cysteine-rich protein n=1 Tax=Lysinibacillus pakistanensis TaxID=759811 RepID=UPI003D2E7DDE
MGISQLRVTMIFVKFYWQYDAVGQDMPDKVIGPNNVSLHQAQVNYKEFGAFEKRFIESVRAPKEDELSENNVEC